MKIKISNLSIGTHDLHYEGNVSELKLNEPFSGAYSLDIQIEKSVHQLIFNISGHADADCECNRCSVIFNQKVQFSETLIFMVERALQYESESDEVVYITPDTDVIDLSEHIYDFAYLSLPMKVLCKEECKGLCTVCGTDLNESTCNCSNEKQADNSPFSQLKNLFNNN